MVQAGRAALGACVRCSWLTRYFVALKYFYFYTTQYFVANCKKVKRCNVERIALHQASPMLPV